VKALADGAGHTFFQQAQLERLLGHDLFQRAGFLAQGLDLVGCRSACRVARQAPLASFQELLRL
jgi:hypothetical protein